MTQATQAARVGRIVSTLSAERLQRYCWGGASLETGIQRYALNVATCEAFYPALQLLEVTLRNRIVDVVRTELPIRYPGLSVTAAAPLVGLPQVASWLDPDWLSRSWPRGIPALLSSYAQQDVQKAKAKLFGTDPTTRALVPPKLGSPLITEGQLVAELDFGFWTGLFHRSFVFRSGTDPRLWGGSTRHPHTTGDLLSRVFPYRNPRFAQVHEVGPLLNDLRHFRNRVFHHEPIFATAKRKSPLDVYIDVHAVLSWIEPEMARVLDTICRVKDVLSRRGERTLVAQVHACMWR
jgi:hypothetical protein